MIRDKIKSKYIVISLALIAALAVFLIWRWVYIANNSVIISRVPSDAKLYVDGKEISGDRTSLSNGTYKVRAEKDGFYSYSDSVIIDDNSKYIAVALEPESSDATKWAKDNQDLYLQQESEFGAKSGEAGATVLNDNPIIDSLPIDGETYSVGYITDNNDKSGNSIIVTVHATSGYRNSAIKDIYNLGFDPADYQIQFSDYTNPFKEYK